MLGFWGRGSLYLVIPTPLRLLRGCSRKGPSNESFWVLFALQNPSQKKANKIKDALFVAIFIVSIAFAYSLTRE